MTEEILKIIASSWLVKKKSITMQGNMNKKFGSLISVCPSVRFEYIVSNWINFSAVGGCYNLPRKYNLVKIGEK
jgi:hypothetical protein